MQLHYDDKTIEVIVSDDSFRERSLMNKTSVVLHFSLAEHIDFPVGTWAEFMGRRYFLAKENDVKKHGTRRIEYSMTLRDEMEYLSWYILFDVADNRIKFSKHATPREFVQTIVDCLNTKGKGVWSVGECIEAAAQTIEFNKTDCLSALSAVASKFNTEFECDERIVSVRKIEHNKDNPLALSYGKGNGLLPGLTRNTSELPITKLFAAGGAQNIDRSKYGSANLLLPKNQSYVYNGVTYTTDASGMYVTASLPGVAHEREEVLDCEHIYPSRVGEVTSVAVVNESKNFYDFIDNTIPADLNFNDYLIEGETPFIRFQSGMLAGEKEFEFKYIHAERRFELVPQEIDGETMPNEVFIPAVGDTYAVFGIMLPDEYICHNGTQSGASWDMFRECVKYYAEHIDLIYQLNGTIQGLWLKKNWENVGGKIVIGGYVSFIDEHLATDGLLTRITSIKEYINRPKEPIIEVSNTISSKGFSATIQKIHGNEVKIEDAKKELMRYTKRRFRDVKETMSMLEDAMLNFSDSINPVTVQTMAALVGDESLQFRFVNSKTDLRQTTHKVTYNSESKQLHCPAGFLQHCTLGIKSISSAHEASEYSVWSVGEFLSGVLVDSSKKYYLYAKVSSSDTNDIGEFLLSERAIAMGEESGFYHLLLGVLNSEFEGTRSYVSLYGFTEILPGRLTTDKIVSSDGRTYFDLAEGKIGGNIHLEAGSTGLKNLDGYDDIDARISAQVTRVDELNRVISEAGWITSAEGNQIWASKRLEDGEELISRINQTAESVTIDAKKINLKGKVSVGDLDGTIIEDGYIKADLINVKKIEATEGSIAGFQIKGVGLTNEGFNNDAYVLFQNENYNTFAGIGGNMYVPSSTQRVVARFKNGEYKNREGNTFANSLNEAVLISALNAHHNYAIRFDGGALAGLAINTTIISANTTSQTLKVEDNNVVAINNNDCILTLPKLYPYHDGYVVRIKRFGNGRLYVKPQKCLTYNSDGSTDYSMPIIIYNTGSAATGGVSDESMALPSRYDAVELVWCRDLTYTWSGTTYKGVWVQYIFQRAW